MPEQSRFWDGTATGDATQAPYDAGTAFSQVLTALTAADRLANKGGVISTSDLNALVPSVSASALVIGTGRALVYGTWYERTGNISAGFPIPTPVTSTRIDRAVVRKSWAAETARLVYLSGVEGGAEPALVQSVGATWDIPVASVSITTGGVITLTDERQFLDPALLNGVNAYGSQQQFKKGADIASATSITLGTDGNSFSITGTTNITTITAGPAGLVVVLIFSAALTVVNGSNLKLKSDFYTAQNSTLSLISDGTNWIELSRTPAQPSVYAGNSQGATLTGGATGYLTLTSNSGNEANANLIAVAGTLRNLNVRTINNQPAGGPLTYTLMLNASPTAITAQVAAGSGAANVSDTTHTVKVVAGDLVDIRAVNGDGTNVSAGTSAWKFEIS